MSHSSHAPDDAGLREAQQRLLDFTLRKLQGRTQMFTKVPGLAMFSRTAPTQCCPIAYEPLLILFLQGVKMVSLGRQTFRCDALSFLLCSIDMPVVSQVTEASPERPHVSLGIRLNMRLVRETMSHEEFSAATAPLERQCLAVGRMGSELLNAVERLLYLQDRPEEIGFLNELIHREIIYRVMRTPQGRHLRAMVTQGDQSQRTARAIAWLKTNYAKPLRIEHLAEMASMGVSTFHHHFRALTALSPLQYQKQLRLLSARERMLSDGLDASSAAFEVGYESASQFSREYRRFFGVSPMRDVKARRSLAPSL